MEVRENEAFTDLLRDAALQAEKMGYRPTHFKRMLEQYGGYETVQRVLATGKPSDGFARLWELRRLDLSCEALIVETRWRQYFDPALIARAEALLAGTGYSFKPYTPQSNAAPLPLHNALDDAANEAQDTSLPVNDIRINSFFRDILLAPVANDRWSWGSVDETQRRVFLRVWRDDIKQHNGLEIIRVLAQQHTNRHGWAERQRHLELINSGYDAYAIVCVKGGTPTTSIGSFESGHLSWLSALANIEGDLYMTLGSTVAVSSLSSHTSGGDLERDLAQIRANEQAETTRTALTDARLGQGRFRRDLMRLWEGRCAVTGTAIAALLRASHCKPWRDSNNDERLDPQNGLPLTANLDALFDALLISFDDEGGMLISSVITPEEREELGIPATLLKKPGPELKRYLEHHRERFNSRRIAS
ncbi:HNH endonuclease [Stenotrophomonas indicatrix]